MDKHSAFHVFDSNHDITFKQAFSDTAYRYSFGGIDAVIVLQAVDTTPGASAVTASLSRTPLGRPAATASCDEQPLGPEPPFRSKFAIIAGAMLRHPVSEPAGFQ